MNQPPIATAELLANCATERIHQPGAIQPHGAALVCGFDGIIHQVSGNAQRWFGRPPSLMRGEPLYRLIGEAAADAVLAVPVRDGGAVLVEGFQVATPDDRAGSIWATRGADAIIVECEEHDDPPSAEPPWRRLAERLLPAVDEQALYDAVVDEIRACAGHDRVMLYRFLPGGDGEVVAERAAPGLEPFLGLRYPAEDIPQQARELYLRARVRVLADTEAEPEPMSGHAPGGALDQGLTALRAMSPLYLQYLRNMGGRASLGASIIVEGRLWGLIICNHGRPRRPAPVVRLFARHAGDLLSVLLLQRIQAQRAAAAADAGELCEEILGRMGRGEPWMRALMARGSELAVRLHAGGCCLLGPDAMESVGQVPDEAVVRALIAGSGMPLVDDGQDRLVAACLVGSGCAGVCMLPVGRRHVLAWFRPEQEREVAWGGDPSGLATAMTLRADGVPVFSPRRSFARWTEQVRGRSRPWSATDRMVAEILVQRIERLVLAAYDVQLSGGRGGRLA